VGSGGRRNGWTVRQGRWWSGGPRVTMGITMTTADELVQERSRQGSESLQRRLGPPQCVPKVVPEEEQEDSGITSTTTTSNVNLE
jgi:hypothetical protein